MEVEKIIKYFLIGNLSSGKVIYEMSNVSKPKTIYEANQIFTLYQKTRKHAHSTKVNTFTVSIFLDNIIMIIKTDELFPIERNFEIFKKIKNSIPNLSELSIDWNLNLYKQGLNEKITKIIYDYFKDLNISRKKVLNTISFKKNEINDIIDEESAEYKKEKESIESKENKESEYDDKKSSKKNNSLISNSIDVDKFSFNSIKLDKTVIVKDRDKNKTNFKSQYSIKKVDNNKSKKITVKMIDEANDKTNMYKSLIQSSSLVKINNNQNNSLSKSRNNLIRESRMTEKYVNDLKNIVSKITCCKRFIFFCIILIIIAQAIAIPLIIKFSYSF